MLLAIIVWFAGFSAGCASIIDGGPQLISLSSDPDEAKITITDIRRGQNVLTAKTPYTATLKRSAGFFQRAIYRVTFEKEGYEKVEVPLEGRVNGWYLGGNLIFGGLLGYLIVDPLTGAMWTLAPKDIYMELPVVEAVKEEEEIEEEAAAEEEGGEGAFYRHGEGLMIVLKSAVPEDLREKMKPVEFD